MKITRVSTLAVEPRWLLVKIETDEGVIGWGECLGDKAQVQAAAVASYEHALIGEDPRRITHLWQAMFRFPFWRGGPALNSAISGIEIALWDIFGKSVGLPVWQLLGGSVRDRIRVYTHLPGETPEALAASAKLRVSQGFTAVKFGPILPCRPLEGIAVIEESAARVQAVREAVGPSVDVLLDLHGRVGVGLAVQLEEAYRPFRPLFIEEPLLPEYGGQLGRLATQFKTPIATGERLFTKWDFREVFEGGAVSVVQPDPCICGGISETRFIAAMAEAHGVSVAPHNPYGCLNFAACLQLDACVPNFLIQEYLHPICLGEGYLKEPFTMRDGYIEVPTAPGVGAEPDEDFLLAHPLGDLPDVGRVYHADDGSVADW